MSKLTEHELVLLAAVDTVEELDQLPENGLEMPTHIARWANLIRRQDSRLSDLSDEQIITVLNTDNEEHNQDLHRLIRIAAASKKEGRK